MPQLIFNWQAQPSYAPEDFIISDANAEAVNFIDSWPSANSAGSKIAILTGPEASGKTHLCYRWLARVKGVILDESAIGTAPSEKIWPNKASAVLENIQHIKDESALFHLLRHAETSGASLLLTSTLPAKELAFALPDLRSRLLALPTAHINPPDELLLRVFLSKGFTDRQLRVNDEILDYIIKRIERSFAAARDITEKIERVSLENKREITIPFIKKLLD